MGVLQIDGHISLGQFWPDAESDADTTKIEVVVGNNAFRYAPDGGNFRVTDVLNDARVVGAKTGPLVRTKTSTAEQTITVRLQGIDAPKLHYRAAPLRGKDWPDLEPSDRQKYNEVNRPQRRQYWGETTTIALADKLSNFGSDRIPCRVISRVNSPHEVPDTYGRVVGNIRVGSGFGTDINI